MCRTWVTSSIKLKNNAQILIPIIGAVIILSWVFLIVPDLKNDISAFETLVERVGEKSNRETIDGELSNPKFVKQTLTHNVVEVEGNILKIESIYRDHDIFTNDVNWEGTDTYYVDKSTRKHMGDEEGYFLFPYRLKNLKRQELLHE